MAKSLLIDANLIVVWLVGLVDPKLLGHHRRVKAYDAEDFDRISAETDKAETVLCCPNTMTEVCNLLVNDKMIDQRVVNKVREFVRLSTEIYTESSVAVDRQEFSWLGLTDCVLLELAGTGATLFTADARLAIAAEEAGLKVINYNHIRDERPDLN